MQCTRPHLAFLVCLSSSGVTLTACLSLYLAHLMYGYSMFVDQENDMYGYSFSPPLTYPGYFQSGCRSLRAGVSSECQWTVYHKRNSLGEPLQLCGDNIFQPCPIPCARVKARIIRTSYFNKTFKRSNLQASAEEGAALPEARWFPRCCACGRSSRGFPCAFGKADWLRLDSRNTGEVKRGRRIYVHSRLLRPDDRHFGSSSSEKAVRLKSRNVYGVKVENDGYVNQNSKIVRFDSWINVLHFFVGKTERFNFWTTNGERGDKIHILCPSKHTIEHLRWLHSDYSVKCLGKLINLSTLLVKPRGATPVGLPLSCYQYCK